MKFNSRSLAMSFLMAASALTIVADDHQMVEPVTEETLVKAYGVDRFDEIEAIKFTFNASLTALSIKREWTWYPKENRVILVDGDKTIEYTRDNITTEEQKSADSKFINDSFWLLWPVHLQWGTDDTLSQTMKAKDPISGEDVTAVTLSYPAEGGGYTPGDKYILYLDKNNRATSWSYFPSGQEKPKLTCTWDDYIKAGPLYISTKHENESGIFKLTFTDITVITD